MINLDAVTIQDCLDLYIMKNRYTVCNDGKIIGFVSDEETKKYIANDDTQRIDAVIA